MRHFVVIPPSEEDVQNWSGGAPAEQGYKVMPLPKLKRPDAKENEYYVYSNEKEFKAIEADSAVSAVMASQIEVPLKVIHAHTRIQDVIDTKKLEYIGKDTNYMEKKGFSGKEIEPIAAKEVTPQPAVSQATPQADAPQPEQLSSQPETAVSDADKNV